MELNKVRWQIENEVQRRLREEVRESKLEKFFIISVVAFVSVLAGFLLGKMSF